MATLIDFVPDEKTLYYVTQAGVYRCHNGFEGGRITFDVEKALTQSDYKFIDCFPTFGGDCSIVLEREYHNEGPDTWEDMAS